MSYQINVVENMNILEVQEPYEPIVCGNTNYTLHFEFNSEEWKLCENKIAIFRFKGMSRKVLFSGTECKVPAIANAPVCCLSLISSEDYGEKLFTPPVDLKLKCSVAGQDFLDDAYFESFLNDILSLINSIKNGHLVIESSNHSNTSDKSKLADHATSSDHSDFANNADIANIANKATEADHANTSTTADHAVTADSATIASSSETQVDLESNQDISGVKDFVGELKYRGNHVLTSATVSNPNLLINGDFRINQRGETSYSGQHEYTADRWINRDASLKITPIKNGGVKIEKISNPELNSASMLSQSIENFENLLGKTVTLSFKIRENTTRLGVGLQIVGGNTSYYASSGLGGLTQWSKGNGIFSETLTLPSLIDYSCLNAIITFEPNEDVGASVVVEWVKLELGDAATTFIPRLYAEELAICQRYFQNIMMNASASSSTSSTIYIPYYLPTTMRTNPTINITIRPSIRGNGSNLSTSNATIIANRVETNFVRLLYTMTGLTQYHVYSSLDGLCSLDAEIY